MKPLFLTLLLTCVRFGLLLAVMAWIVGQSFVVEAFSRIGSREGEILSICDDGWVAGFGARRHRANRNEPFGLEMFRPSNVMPSWVDEEGIWTNSIYTGQFYSRIPLYPKGVCIAVRHPYVVAFWLTCWVLIRWLFREPSAPKPPDTTGSAGE